MLCDDNGYDENGKYFEGYVELTDELHKSFSLDVPLMGKGWKNLWIIHSGMVC